MLQSPSDGYKTPTTPKIEFFVTLVDGLRPQTSSTTKIFILDGAMVLDMCEKITRTN